MEDASALNTAQGPAHCLSLNHTATARYGAQQERFTAPLQSTWEGYPSALREENGGLRAPSKEGPVPRGVGKVVGPL